MYKLIVLMLEENKLALCISNQESPEKIKSIEGQFEVLSAEKLEGKELDQAKKIYTSFGSSPMVLLY